MSGPAAGPRICPDEKRRDEPNAEPDLAQQARNQSSAGRFDWRLVRAVSGALTFGQLLLPLSFL